MPQCHTGLGEEGPRRRLALKCNTSCLPSSRICFHSPASVGIQSVGEPQPGRKAPPAPSPVFIQGLVSELPPVTSSSCSCDFFKWRLFIRLPPPARDCVKLHGLICASMIRARREICAPPRFPRRFTISRLPFSSFACCHCLVPCSGCVLLLLALPVDSFMCSARTDLLAKQNSRLIKRKRNPKKRILGQFDSFITNRQDASAGIGSATSLPKSPPSGHGDGVQRHSEPLMEKLNTSRFERRG